jgi:hypothetical protein
MTDGIEQGTMQHRPEHDDDRLRQQPAEPGHVERAEEASTVAPDLASRGNRATRNDDIGEADAAQRRQRIRCEQERESELTWTSRALEDPHTPSGTLQSHTRGKATDAGADDEGCWGVNSQLPTPNFQASSWIAITRTIWALGVGGWTLTAKTGGEAAQRTRPRRRAIRGSSQ